MKVFVCASNSLWACVEYIAQWAVNIAAHTHTFAASFFIVPSVNVCLCLYCFTWSRHSPFTVKVIPFKSRPTKTSTITLQNIFILFTCSKYLFCLVNKCSNLWQRFGREKIHYNSSVENKQRRKFDGFQFCCDWLRVWTSENFIFVKKKVNEVNFFYQFFFVWQQNTHICMHCFLFLIRLLFLKWMSFKQN